MLEPKVVFASEPGLALGEDNIKGGEDVGEGVDTAVSSSMVCVAI